MKQRSHVVQNSGLSFFTVLFLIFLTLKLCGVIGWSWWWITAPLWGSFGLAIAIVMLAIPFYLISSYYYDK